ncbi:hypothetical protein BJ742DRAFT_734613 [Cladochytrium replicatum]|nr:hypothetical protein BJ742DRAFT_734613 [Cladochytrium replicatum]
MTLMGVAKVEDSPGSKEHRMGYYVYGQEEVDQLLETEEVEDSFEVIMVKTKNQKSTSSPEPQSQNPNEDDVQYTVRISMLMQSCFGPSHHLPLPGTFLEAPFLVFCIFAPGIITHTAIFAMQSQYHSLRTSQIVFKGCVLGNISSPTNSN